MTNIVEQVVKHFGSQNKLAKALKISRQNIRQYIGKGSFPAKRAISIEDLTDGKFTVRQLLNGKRRANGEDKT